MRGQTACLHHHKVRPDGAHVVHVGGQPREGHDRMILGHRDDHGQPEPDFFLAFV